METRAHYVLVGAFVVALLSGLLVAVLWLARIQFGEQSTFYDIYFTGSVAGLNDGSPVRLSGIQIGQVSEIKLDPNNPQQVSVTIQVKSDAQINADSVASLEIEGLTGGAFVEISGGSAAAGPIRPQPGQRYPVIASRQSALQQLLASVPEVLRRLVDLSDRLSSVVDDKNRAALAETLDNLRRVSAAAANHSDDIEHLLANGGAAAGDLRAVAGNLNEATRQFGDVAKQAATLVNHADSLVGELDTVVKDNRRPIQEFGQSGLPQLQQLIADSHKLVTELTRAVDLFERDPSRLLYGDRREGYQPK
jgi:phospholipid/cholesterol/gamma-HCH transport system substrate-binding protein